MKKTATGVAALLSLGLAGAAQAEIFEGMPDVVVCEVDSGERSGRLLFYLSSQEDGGLTRYTTLGAAPMQIAIGPDGKVSDNALTDCSGKTILQLRDNRQAFDVD